jgi:hypothetical protein
LKGEQPVFEGFLDSKQPDDATNFDFLTFRLSLNHEKIRTTDVTLLGHSQHFSKLLTLLSFIDSHLDASNVNSMNKRALYYHHKDKSIESTGELDQYLSEIGQMLRVTRD